MEPQGVRPDGVAMTLEEEVKALSEQIAACPDGAVGEFAAVITAEYEEKRTYALTLFKDAVVDGVINEQQPTLRRIREVFLRDRLRNLLAWAKASGRL
jgi:hypothetical protein